MPAWTLCPELPIDLDRDDTRLPPEVIASGARLLDAVLTEFPAESKALADLARLRTANRFHHEAKRYARLVDRPWREVMLANIAYDLALAMFGCSTSAVATPQGPVLARNMDWWPEDLLAQATYTIRYRRKGETAVTAAGWPGAIGVVTGMSSRGFAVSINAVCAPEGTDKTGYPVLLHIRRVLEDATDFNDALDQLTKTKLTVGALFMLVGQHNHERVVIERTPSRHALRWAEGDHPLLVTNDYRLLDAAQASGELYETACSRFDKLTKLTAELDPTQPISDEALLYCLTDPQVQMGITAQHTIFRPHVGLARNYVPTRLLAGSKAG